MACNNNNNNNNSSSSSNNNSSRRRWYHRYQSQEQQEQQQGRMITINNNDDDTTMIKEKNELLIFHLVPTCIISKRRMKHNCYCCDYCYCDSSSSSSSSYYFFVLVALFFVTVVIFYSHRITSSSTTRLSSNPKEMVVVVSTTTSHNSNSSTSSSRRTNTTTTTRFTGGWVLDPTADLPYKYENIHSFWKRCIGLSGLAKECNPLASGCSANLSHYTYIRDDDDDDDEEEEEEEEAIHDLGSRMNTNPNHLRRTRSHRHRPRHNGGAVEKFDTERFRRQMANRRILFMGCSLMRQQFVALGLAMGVTKTSIVHFPLYTTNATDQQYHTNKDPDMYTHCSHRTRCWTEQQDNITVCHHFLGTMTTQPIYISGNFTFNHSLRGHGDSSCIFSQYPHYLNQLGTSFDVIFVQSVAWWGGLPSLLDSPTSPKSFIQHILPTVYTDAMRALLTPLSDKTKTILVLGQTGTAHCQGKTQPLPLSELPPYQLPNQTAASIETYGWTSVIPHLWKASIHLVRNDHIPVQIVDVRKPLMSSIHAHYGHCTPIMQTINPQCQTDCLHFCINSAALYSYLDYYQVEVFDPYFTPS